MLRDPHRQGWPAPHRISIAGVDFGTSIRRCSQRSEMSLRSMLGTTDARKRPSMWIIGAGWSPSGSNILGLTATGRAHR